MEKRLNFLLPATYDSALAIFGPDHDDDDADDEHHNHDDDHGDKNC